MYIEYCYLVYLAISISVTVWVARTLYKNGHIFLVDAFNGNADVGQVFGETVIVNREIDEVANPLCREFHGNQLLAISSQPLAKSSEPRAKS